MQIFRNTVVESRHTSGLYLGTVTQSIANNSFRKQAYLKKYFKIKFVTNIQYRKILNGTIF